MRSRGNQARAECGARSAEVQERASLVAIFWGSIHFFPDGAAAGLHVRSGVADFCDENSGAMREAKIKRARY